MLQLVFALRIEELDVTLALSLITSWCMWGMKISKVPYLQKLWSYKRKQKNKVMLLTASVRSDLETRFGIADGMSIAWL